MWARRLYRRKREINRKIQKNMIYSVKKTLEIAACHRLNLSYESKCQNLHGHNWHITVFLASNQKNTDGMVMDFKHIKNEIHGYLDHGNLNELLDFNPTAENIAEWIVEKFPLCYKAIVEESDNNFAQAFDESFPIDPLYLL